jgi:Raf kinase inhibitor-like YbhB/YbcL family protein
MKTESSVVALLACVACRDASVSPGPVKGTTPATVDVTSSAFGTGSQIPTDYTCDGADQSPDLSWTSMPNTARSIAIIAVDPDAPSGNFTHWILWNMKPEARALNAGGNGGFGGGTGGTNDFGHVGYNGPCPPKGKLHHYHFKVYGLDAMLTLTASNKRSELDSAMNGHVVASGDLVGTFQH